MLDLGFFPGETEFAIIFPFKSLCHTLTNPFSPKGLSFHIYFLSMAFAGALIAAVCLKQALKKPETNPARTLWQGLEFGYRLRLTNRF